MSEIMRPMPFGEMMNWALEEYTNQERIFGVQKTKFYKSTSGARISVLGEEIATPIGPAAGPNSQLAQNIIASYLVGSRFMELKTVQKMDGEELSACVPRPCINAEDEGYNVEWSTELTVPQALDEYIKAWIAIHVLAKETGISTTRDFVFNMSVGYDLDGIKTPKIDTYINQMKNASNSPVWKESMAWLQQNSARFNAFAPADIEGISPNVSSSITLSTLHGCPPAEIERIAKYLLDEKGVHTFVKCNPTLLGYEFARKVLNEMGYDYISFDEHHFQNDLQYSDAVAMFRRLMDFAAERSLQFGVKITNTFPVEINRKELPGEEMYMSGRALLPLSINVASKLAQDFDGALPISYSGGADAFNIEGILQTGICPITMATTILKPGGYERMFQLANQLEPLMATMPTTVDKVALAKFASAVPSMQIYNKDFRPVASRKTDVPLPLFDCYQAPCKQGGCPIQQQIPEYLSLVAQERYDEAMRVIAVDNTAPSITGVLCPHTCQDKCTRLDYDAPLQIRSAKLQAANAAQAAFNKTVSPAALKTKQKAVVVGAGPAGIAAALFLRRCGMDVTVLEKRDKPYGIVQYVIPQFRISDDEIMRDFATAQNAGVTFKFNTSVADINELKNQYDYVLLAVGAWKEGISPVKTGGENLRDALAFLEESKAADCKLALGKRVAVLGGGDVAMDCARAALRAPGVESSTIVYRRTKAFMPAHYEEIHHALADGVQVMELLAPVGFASGKLTCEKMQLGDWDESGRRGIVGTGETMDLAFDTVIGAVGARVDSSLFAASGLALDGKNRPTLSPSCESSLPNVYVIGDCKAGPSTVVWAIADAKAAAADILAKAGIGHDFVRVLAPQDMDVLYARKGALALPQESAADGYRCLACDQLCELCCDVCPNRANVRISVPGFANAHQIMHVDGMCNECGNCGTFCPHLGNPYKDKITLFWSEEDLHDSTNKGFARLADGNFALRLEDGSVITCALSDERVPAALSSLIRTVMQDYSYYFVTLN